MPRFRQSIFIVLGILPSFLLGNNDITITYPNVGTLYSNDGNGLTIDWDYQSQSDDIQSLSWSYKLDEDYSTGGNGTEVYGHDRGDKVII